jgi:hypothetical protein
VVSPGFPYFADTGTETLSRIGPRLKLINYYSYSSHNNSLPPLHLS